MAQPPAGQRRQLHIAFGRQAKLPALAVPPAAAALALAGPSGEAPAFGAAPLCLLGSISTSAVGSGERDLERVTLPLFCRPPSWAGCEAAGEDSSLVAVCLAAAAAAGEDGCLAVRRLAAAAAGEAGCLVTRRLAAAAAGEDGCLVARRLAAAAAGEAGCLVVRRLAAAAANGDATWTAARLAAAAADGEATWAADLLAAVTGEDTAREVGRLAPATGEDAWRLVCRLRAVSDVRTGARAMRAPALAGETLRFLAAAAAAPLALGGCCTAAASAAAPCCCCSLALDRPAATSADGADTALASSFSAAACPRAAAATFGEPLREPGAECTLLASTAAALEVRLTVDTCSPPEQQRCLSRWAALC